MADNYIERQQEQYEARKAAWKQAQKYGKKKLTAVRPAESKSHTSTVSKPEDSKRRVFITGGAEGIGKAIVEAFRLAGNQVAFCDINETSGQETAKATGAIFHKVDVSDKNALESCMQTILAEWNDIDIIVNNVGISKFSSITETSVEDFDKILSKPSPCLFHLYCRFDFILGNQEYTLLMNNHCRACRYNDFIT